MGSKQKNCENLLFFHRLENSVRTPRKLYRNLLRALRRLSLEGGRDRGKPLYVVIRIRELDMLQEKTNITDAPHKYCVLFSVLDMFSR